jgi:hypothetical protein
LKNNNFEEKILTVNARYDFYNKQLDALISQIYFGMKLNVTDSSSVHHQELFTVHSAMVYVIQVCTQLSSSSRIMMELQRVQDGTAVPS